MNKSQQMSRVRSRNTAAELYVRQLLSKHGVRYRLHRADLPGRPDLYVPRLKLAVFVNGCFWHGHNCSRGRRPKTNRVFWEQKIARNAARDRRVMELLLELGVESLVLWTCELGAVPETCRLLGRRYRRRGRFNDHRGAARPRSHKSY